VGSGERHLAGGADAIIAIWNGLKATFFNIGGALIDGLVAGIRAGFDWVGQCQ
jgi:hypothetical protein